MAIRGEQRTSEANFWLLPSPAVYGEAALGITSARNYTATDYEPFFRDIGYPEGFSQYERARKLYGQDVSDACVLVNG